VDTKKEGDHDNEEDEVATDDEETDIKGEDEDVEVKKHKHKGKEPRTIDKRENVNTSSDHVDTIVDYQLIVVLEQGQEIHKPTLRLKSPAPAP
jgi:hypothetical protein